MATAVMEGPHFVNVDGDTAGVAAASGQRTQSGFLCSTSGEVITDRETLKEHYTSDFHRYNLKRKVAGLPPVTREWFEARKAQLASAQAVGAAMGVPAGHTRVWVDPLTRKTFRTEQTYQAHVRSNKYAELVRKSGQPAPPPVITVRKVTDADQQDAAAAAAPNRAAPTAAQQQVGQKGFKVVAPSGGLPGHQKKKKPQQEGEGEEDDEEEVDEDGWETASDDEEVAQGMAQLQLAGGAIKEEGEEGEDEEDESKWEEWDLCRSLFDNHVSKDFEANLEYMWRKYGFYMPDAQYLADPEGLFKYLGAKVRYGRVPLYSRGDDDNAKQFRSLHAVQRHMVDSGKCKMVYEDNEDEYADFYDYTLGDEEDEEEEAGAGKELVVSGRGGRAEPAAALVTAASELMIPGGSGQGAKVLGSRAFARYYRQRHRPVDERQIVVVNTLHARYRALGIELADDAVALEVKKAKTRSRMDLKWDAKRNQALYMRGNINRDLPKNVPY
eukprot:CAMPEP_0202858630 /NCGR_PEP_ID=MMETSP1391-20130828/1075_1 /ASSEMBLY_ACC=CAM_ASM_000867 /TAXON_ID=1034604 /ORGANISM="Chlamydomonas leiostraca, Strain SAG 11-49" /LENGTH=497 /DNA_ID=CAMNT_0049537563 /DNA_START=94 /DNA_END=1587 /DNA_ORIENTATION=+